MNNFDFVIEVKEVGYDIVSVTWHSGKHASMDGIGLAKDWLTMSNDDFYEKYGFNFVPSDKLKDKARKELN